MLNIGVMFVNGWTDAPNAIASCVSTRSLSPRRAVFLAAVCNLFGAVFMTKVNNSVSQTVLRLADFGGDSEKALSALCAAMVSVVLWAVAAWYFGIPTSESHALTAGLFGASLSVSGGASSFAGFGKVLFGVIFSVIVGFALGFLIVKITCFVCKNKNRRETEPVFRNLQIVSAALMAFMHGAQDSQKFLSVFILGFCLSQGESGAVSADIPFWLAVFCAGVISVGTSAGGYRIIKAVGMDMVNLERYQGFAADLAGGICLLISSFTGLPVSTTQTKTAAMTGAGTARNVKSVNFSVALRMVYGWFLTFPGCMLLGYAASKIFFNIF